MSKKEITKWEIIEKCCNGDITARDASLRLNISVRQVENLKVKFRQGISFIHGNCGRKPAKTLSNEHRQKILEEYKKDKYKDVSFYHFYELIANTDFVASYTAIRKLLISEGFKSPEARKKKSKTIHRTRERRSKFGELLQTDASEYDWFRNGNTCALHGYIDDATSRLTGLYFSPHECMQGYLEITRQTLVTYGTPEAIYADGSSVFFPIKKEELTIEEELEGITERKTQFGEICDELGIILIHAKSSQAKGRIERLWKTLQRRLPVELAIRGITDINKGNDFLTKEFIPMFNNRFTVNEDTKSCFVTLPSTVNLDELLSYKIERKVDNGGCFSLNGIKFKIEGQISNCKILILISKRLGVVAKYKDNFYDVEPMKVQRKSINSNDSIEMILARFVHFYTLKNEHLA